MKVATAQYLNREIIDFICFKMTVATAQTVMCYI